MLLIHRSDACLMQSHLQLSQQSFQDVLHALLPIDRQAEDIRAAYQHALGAQRKRFDDIHAVDWNALVQHYLISSRRPLLSATVSGSAHPLILLADAYDLANANVAVEALAMLAIDYNPLHKLLDASVQSNPVKSSVLDTLARIRTDERFDGLFDTPGVRNTSIVLKSKPAATAVLEYLNALTIRTPAEALNELAIAAALLLCATDDVEPSGKREFDMYLTHQLTFVWSARVLVLALPPTATKLLLRAAWLMMILTSITQLRPVIVPTRLTRSSLADKEAAAEWTRLTAVALNSTTGLDDPHYTKVIQTLREFAMLWPEDEGLFLGACVLFEREWVGWKGFDAVTEH